MNSLYGALAFLAGAGLVLQMGMNARIGREIGNMTAAATINFGVGFLGLLAFLLLARVPAPAREQWVAVPAWAWLGGLFGAFYVALVTLVGPRIGALWVLALSVAGQMIASIVVDHYGLLGFAQQPVTTTRLLGAGLLLAGVLLVAR